jgi:hypothetical protein
MKRFFTLSALILILLNLLVCGCSRNQTTVTQTDGIPLRKGATTIYTNLSVPAWILFPIEETSAIGIAPDYIKDDKSASQNAQEFAWQSLAMNSGTFSYSKELLASLPDEYQDEAPVADLGLVPTGNLHMRNDQIEKLKIVGETSIAGYRFIIIGNPETKLNQDLVTVSAATLPEWCMQREVWEGEKHFYAVGAGEAATLTEAWQQAQQKALVKLAYHALREQRPELHSERSIDEKAELLEKTFANLSISFDKNWFFQRQVDSKDLFNVYIMLKLNK